MIAQKAKEEKEELVALLDASSAGGTFPFESRFPEPFMPEETRQSNVKKVSSGFSFIPYEN